MHEIVFKGIGDDASLTSGLETGAIQGAYPQAISTLHAAAASQEPERHEGPSFAVDAMVICNLQGHAQGRPGAPGAVDGDRPLPPIFQAIYHGTAQLPRALENPGAWGYGKSVFQRNWQQPAGADGRPDQGASSWSRQAGAQGKSITIGTTSEIQSLATAANLVRQAATEIGLKATIDSVSAADFINFFTDAGARKGIDMFPTSQLPGLRRSRPACTTPSPCPGGTQNYDNFSDPAITKPPEAALGRPPTRTSAPSYVAKAGDLIMQQLPWIPLARPGLAARHLQAADRRTQPRSSTWAARGRT